MINNVGVIVPIVVLRETLCCLLLGLNESIDDDDDDDTGLFVPIAVLEGVVVVDKYLGSTLFLCSFCFAVDVGDVSTVVVVVVVVAAAADSESDDDNKDATTGVVVMIGDIVGVDLFRLPNNNNDGCFVDALTVLL
jgi:hypothetical protein